MIEERLAKRLARAGLCSRRQAEEWIKAGRVAVNGEKITLPQFMVSDHDEIICDKKRVPIPENKPRIFLYHKPRGVVTTERDPEGRPTIFDKLPKNLPRLIAVGRLDMNSEGLLLLTTSGEMARTLELPKSKIERTYHVRIYGELTKTMQDKMRKGLTIKGIKYQPIHTKILSKDTKNKWIEFRLTEGKNREIRNVVAYFGLRLNRLKRVAYGPYKLGELKSAEIKEAQIIPLA